MKKLKNIISKIILILITIYLIVFSAIPSVIPETTQVYAAMTEGQLDILRKMVVAYAYSWVGVTKYSTTKRTGLNGYEDCSGFVKAIYEQFGYKNVPYNTDAWLKNGYGKRVAKAKEWDYTSSIKDLKLGDVIVTTTTRRIRETCRNICRKL